MADDRLRFSRQAEPDDAFAERRREERFEIPEVYRRYIRLTVKTGMNVLPAMMCNFSRHGLLFDSPVPLVAGTQVECVIVAPQLLTKEISFRINIKFCSKKGSRFMVGAAIETITDKLWFDVFVEVHDYIVQRKDEVY
jgi:hypothetical protein